MYDNRLQLALQSELLIKSDSWRSLCVELVR